MRYIVYRHRVVVRRQSVEVEAETAAEARRTAERFGDQIEWESGENDEEVDSTGYSIGTEAVPPTWEEAWCEAWENLGLQEA